MIEKSDYHKNNKSEKNNKKLELYYFICLTAISISDA